MSIYRGIVEQNGTTARAQALARYEKLASTHAEYRRVVADVAKARTHHEEIDALLSWLYILTHDVIHHVIDERTGELARYDHDTKHPIQYRYTWHAPKEHGLHDTEYAGSLDEEGAPQDFGEPIYGTLFSDLYDEVMQNVAYTHYNIPRMYHRDNVVVPMSACTPWEVEHQTYKEWITDNPEELTE